MTSETVRPPVTVHSRVIDGVACALLCVLVVLLYHGVTGLWWSYDDAFHLHQVTTHTWSEILIAKTFWQALPNQVFTPLLFAAIKLTVQLLGLNPAAFYWVHLLAVCASTVVLYIALRLWLPPLWSFAGAAVTAAGPPFVDMTTQLYHLHYVLGLVLALGTIVFTVFALRRNQMRMAIAGAVCYFGAMCFKEVYVPLPLILFYLPEGTFRLRMRYLLPSAGSLLLYAFWRTAMIGPQLSGYGLAVPPDERLHTAATLPWRMLGRIGGGGPITAPMFLVVVSITLLAVFLRLPQSRRLYAAGALAAVLPIVPMYFRIETRYTFTAWILIGVATSFIGRALPRAGPAMMIIIAVVTVAANRGEWGASYPLMLRMSAEGRALATMTETDVILDPAIPPAAFAEMRWLTQGRGTALYDELPVCTGQLMPGARLWTFQANALRQLDAATLRNGVCKRIDESMPLSVQFRYSGGVLWWTLGPSQTGTYHLVVGDGVQAFEMPPRAGFTIAEPPFLTIRVRHNEPTGQHAYSPLLNVPLKEGATVEWHR